MYTDPFGLLVDTLKYNGRQLTLYDDDGNVKWTGRATSGRGDATTADQGEANKGPIPEGTYTTGQIFHEQGVDKVVFRIRTLGADWGNYRTPLSPVPGTDTKGRSRFWLHGGNTPGSAGCIDVGQRDKSLFTLLQRHGNPVPLIVDYPQGAIRTAR